MLLSGPARQRLPPTNALLIDEEPCITWYSTVGLVTTSVTTRSLHAGSAPRQSSAAVGGRISPGLSTGRLNKLSKTSDVNFVLICFNPKTPEKHDTLELSQVFCLFVVCSVGNPFLKHALPGFLFTVPWAEDVVSSTVLDTATSAQLCQHRLLVPLGTASPSVASLESIEVPEGLSMRDEKHHNSRRDFLKV